MTMQTCSKCLIDKEDDKFYRKHRQCSACMMEYNKLHKNGSGVRYKRRLRIDAITKYGGACACCGNSNVDTLCIDHEHGGGATHRRQLGGQRISRWLQQHGYPAGFRVLCFNCNYGVTRVPDLIASVAEWRSGTVTIDDVLRTDEIPDVSRRQKLVVHCRNARTRLRKQAIVAYGGKCELCSETYPHFLTIDHTCGDGAEHRTVVSAPLICRWLRRHNYPTGFRLLCWNCNCTAPNRRQC
jgi:hypothetical protein